MGLMANQVLRAILSEIREANIFAVLADEASDVSLKEQLCVCIRWVDESFTVHETPLELINVPKTDSKTLASVIKYCLVRFSLTINQCRGQAYDGESNMSGHIRGVAAQIQACATRLSQTNIRQSLRARTSPLVSGTERPLASRLVGYHTREFRGSLWPIKGHTVREVMLPL